MNSSFRAFELADRFEEGWRTFYESKGSFSAFYQGPCLHFHRRTISALRQMLSENNAGYRDVCQSTAFIELLYATLTAWGMNRMGGGPKLQDFSQFQHALSKQLFVDALNSLKGMALVDLDDVEKVCERVREAFDYLATDNRIMKSNKALVGISKTLHHLLPDLLIPVDREYTTNLLSHVHEDKYRPAKQGDTFRDYWKCISFSYLVTRRVDLTHALATSTRPMDTSVPKLIDNSIVGLTYRLVPKKGKEGKNDYE